MISNSMAQRINKQINMEMYSAYFYLALCADAEAEDLRGTAAWFMAKHREEMTHALKLYRYLLDQDARVELGAVAAPPARVGGPLEMFDRTLAHEREVTRSINDLIDAALAEKDHATHIFMQWFVTEQIEEEATVREIIGRLRLVGDKGEGRFMIDNELAGIAQRISQASPTPG